MPFGLQHHDVVPPSGGGGSPVKEGGHGAVCGALLSDVFAGGGFRTVRCSGPWEVLFRF